MGAAGPPSVGAFALACVLWLVVGVLPGLLAATALDPSRSLLDRVAVSPLLTVAVAFGVSAWWPRDVGRAIDVAGWSLVLVAVASAVVLAVRRRHVGRRWAPPRLSPTAGRLSLAALVPVLLWVAAIAVSRPGFSLVVPGSDGTKHGVIVARMLLTGSVDPTVVVSTDLASTAADGAVYPVGLHVVAAQVARLAGTAPSLVVPLTVLASVWLVLSCAALARRFATPRAVLATALAASLLVPWVGAGQVFWAPAPMGLAVALVPVAAVVVLDVASWAGAVLAGLSLAGLAALHISEVIVVALLVGLALVLPPRRAGVRRAVAYVAGTVAVAVVAVAPLLLEQATGAGIVKLDPSPHRGVLGSLASAIVHPFVPSTYESPTLVVVEALAAVLLLVAAVRGARIVWPTPTGRATVLVILAATALAALAFATATGALGAPWYGNGNRLTVQSAALLPCLLGPGLVSLVDGAGASRAVLLRIAVGAVALVAVATFVVTGSGGINAFSVVTGPDRAAFAWLADRSAPGSRVLNDHVDGSTWAYDATRGLVNPMFAIKPGREFEEDPAFADRLYLRDHAADVATDARVAALARRWDVRYLVVGEDTFQDQPPLIDADAVARSPGWTLVFQEGGAKVYERVGS